MFTKQFEKDIFPLLEQEESVWERMRTCGKPIVLYGMGDGAQKILDECARRGITVAEIFASDEFVRGHSFQGFRVRKYSELCALYDEFMVAVAFATQLESVLDQIYHIASLRETVAPDVPVTGEKEVFDGAYLALHRDELAQTYGLLADERSRQVFVDVLRYKISGRLRELRSSQDCPDCGYELLSLGADEDYVDLGAYRGDTIRSFLDCTQGSFHSITAFEPDEKTFRKLTESVSGLSGVECHPLGAWSHRDELYFAQKAGRNSALSQEGGRRIMVDSVDNVLQGERASYIKFDVEGAEREALLGCARTISAHHPKLCVSAYHRTEDIFSLPLLVHRLCPEYRLYLRRFPYIPAWDLNLYALPPQ